MKPPYGCYVLDVGHGNAALIEGQNGAVLVDAGPSKIALINFLEAHGVTSLNAVFLSHADADHIAGLAALLSKANTDEKFKIGHIYANPDGRDTKAWEDLIALLDDMEERKLITFTPNLGVDAPEGVIDLGGCCIELIAPSKYMRIRAVGGKHREGGTQTANSLSAVIHVTHGEGGWLLLPGDLDHIGFQDAIRHRAWRTAPVIVFPHHGGRAGSEAHTKELAETILHHTESQWVLFSGRSNSDLFPSELVVDTLLAIAPPPTMVSIGLSPVLAQRIKGLDPCHHRNGEGTLLIFPPDKNRKVRIDRYQPEDSFSHVLH